MVDLIEVQTTVGSEDEAGRIADRLLSERLAACVQVTGPIVSRYWWQGTLEQANEWVCTAKSVASLYERIEAAIRAVHSYEEPQIVAVAVLRASAGYEQWVRDEVQLPPRQGQGPTP
ncbi:MAG: divalent-cation tolerance protein CutA [Planctomycetaceae bacterium]